jgi:hypothetical protein
VETPLIFGEKFHFNAQQVGYQFVSIINFSPKISGVSTMIAMLA